jgi:hypothetical protein
LFIQLPLLGEDGIFYKDLYYLVKFLPAYALPHGIPSRADLANQDPHNNMISPTLQQDGQTAANETHTTTAQRPVISGNSTLSHRGPVSPHLPLPVTSSTPGKKNFDDSQSLRAISGENETVILSRNDEKFLLPASMSPKYHIFDLFPFSLLVKMLTKRGKDIKGKKAAKLRAKMRDNVISHNLPLEISLYLASLLQALALKIYLPR